MSPTDSQRLAHIAGWFFALTFATSIAGLIVYDPVLNNTDYIVGAGAETRVLLGAFFEVLLVFANIGTAFALYPLLKRQSQSMSIGYVAVRVVESTIIAVGNGILLGTLMYRSGLVPRRMALLGVIGGPLIFASSTAILFGAYDQTSGTAFPFSVPEIAWEASLAVYLIVKGFKTSSRVLRPSTHAGGLAPAAAAP